MRRRSGNDAETLRHPAARGTGAARCAGGRQPAREPRGGTAEARAGARIRRGSRRDREQEVFSEAIELEYGIETIAPLAFVMRAMIAQLTARLPLRGLAAGDITLALGLTDRRRDERRVRRQRPRRSKCARC